MPEINFKANRLTGTDVDRVSLVKRASSRLPFRIQKSGENDVIDLNRLGRFLKGDTAITPPSATLAAVLLHKSADPRLAGVILRCAGIDHEDKLTKSEGTEAKSYAITGVEFDENDAGIVKLSDDSAIVVTGLKKAFSGYDFSSDSFKDVMAQGAFFPSISVALDMMRNTAMNIMDSADSPADAAEALQKACGEFSNYLGTLAKALPVHAFKAEVALHKAMPEFIQAKIDEKKKKEGATDSDNEGGKKDKAKKAERSEKPEAIADRPVFGNATEAPKWGERSDDIENNPRFGNQTGNGAPTGDNGNIEGKPAFGNATEKPLPVRKAGEGEAITAETLDSMFVSFVETLGASLDERLSKTEAAMTARMDELAGKTDSAAERARKAEETARNVIFGETRQDAPVQKSEREETGRAPPLLDTSLDRSHLNDRDERGARAH